MTTLAPEPQTTATNGSGPAITHWVCGCAPNTALCGADVTDEPWMDDDEDPDCVVCNDLYALDCPRCGL